MRKLISVVVPVFNNQKTLEPTCSQIIDTQRSQFPHCDLEILFVNDGSKDGSWAELLRLRELNPGQVALLNLSRNFGQYGALFAGFNHARGDAVICVSADMQDPIALIGEMVTHWEKGVEIVVGYREQRRDGYRNRLFSSWAYAIARISTPELPQGGFDYWLMSRRICEKLCSFKGRHNFIQGYLLSMGFTKTFIPYVRKERAEGKSGYSFGKKMKIFIDFLVDASYLPIRTMSVLGAFTAFSGLIYSCLIVYARIQNETPFPGWAPIMILLMIIGGMIMMMLGFIGEYIWRVYDNIKDFPVFIVSERLDRR